MTRFSDRNDKIWEFDQRIYLLYSIINGKEGTMKRLILCLEVVLFTFFMNVFSVSADEYPWKHSVSSKFLMFFPNQADPGLKDFNAGPGTGVDVRFNILSTSVFNLQVGPEWDLIMFSIKDTSTPIDETLIFNTYKMKANLMMVFLPQKPVSIFLGGGMVYNFAFIFGNASLVGQTFNVNATGSGVGAQAMGGIDIGVAKRGTITLELTLPISQKHSIDYKITDQETGDEISSFSRDMNVGGIEFHVGYRFNFATPYKAPELQIEEVTK